MNHEENWFVEARGRKVAVRVVLDSAGGGATLLRYSVENGLAQSGLNVKVTTREEAAVWIQQRVDELLGPELDGGR